jgi:nucleoid DNA-binding protein
MEVIIIIFLREMEEERKEKHKENMFGFGLFDLRERTQYLASLTFLSF